LFGIRQFPAKIPIRNFIDECFKIATCGWFLISGKKEMAVRSDKIHHFCFIGCREFAAIHELDMLEFYLETGINLFVHKKSFSCQRNINFKTMVQRTSMTDESFSEADEDIQEIFPVDNIFFVETSKCTICCAVPMLIFPKEWDPTSDRRNVTSPRSANPALTV
jgi:hypothetical protein